MGKDFRQSIKASAKKAVKTHYVVLLLLCLFGAVFGTEYRTTLLALNSPQTFHTVTQLDVDTRGIEILIDLTSGNFDEAYDKATVILEEYENETDTTDTVLGHTQGVTAKVVNEISSGMFIVRISTVIGRLIESGTYGTIAVILGLTLLLIGGYIFVSNVIQVVIQRYFLEARKYERLSFRSMVYMVRAKTWVKVAVTKLIKSIILTAGFLFLFPYVVVKYMYYLVNPILAENPSLGWKKTLRLSRRMMRGHKWEAFKLELSMLGWKILGLFTLGWSSLLWFNSYHTAVITEYYVYLRGLAKENKIEDCEMLNDEYLYEYAPKEVLETAYADYMDDRKYINEHPMELGKYTRFFADNFSIWLGSTKHKLEYQDLRARRLRVEKDLATMDNRVYPERLAPLYVPDMKQYASHMTWDRVYTIWSLAGMFLLFCIIGWIWEVIVTLFTQGVFVNRGTMLGPWLPIYGCGGFLALTVLTRLRKDPLKTFVAAMVMSGIIEYLASYILETNFGERWWDYTGYFITLHGRISGEGLLIFGVGCIAIIYAAGPMLDTLFSRLNTKYTVPVICTLLLLFGVDMLHSMVSPNIGHGITDNEAGQTSYYNESVETGHVIEI